MSGVFRRLLSVCENLCVYVCVVWACDPFWICSTRKLRVWARAYRTSLLHMSYCSYFVLFQTKLQCHVGACAWASFLSVTKFIVLSRIRVCGLVLMGVAST